MVRFKNRQEAIQRLYTLLDKNSIDDNTIILAISKNGVFYAQELAKKLGFIEADFLFSEAITSPKNKECIIGRVSETEDVVLIEELIDAFEISKDFVYEEAKRLHNEKIISYIYEYRYGDGLMDLKGKRVILVDEGANSGLTLEVCIKSCINQGVKQVDVAIPVVPSSLAKQIKKIGDYCYFVCEIDNFVDTNFYFEDKKDEYEL